MATNDPQAAVENVSASVKSLTLDQKKMIVATVAQNSTAADNKAIAQQSGLGQPDPKTRDRLWMIVVTTFALALLTAVTILSVGVFVTPAMGGTPTGTILAIFTGVSGFLSGLFVPSPGAQSGSGNTAG